MIIDMDYVKRTGQSFVAVDGTTGQRIPYVFWCDTDTGEYQAFRTKADGKTFLIEYVDGKPRIARYRGLCKCLRLVPVTPAGPSRPSNLPLDEEIARKAVQVPQDDNAECEIKGCHRRATWLTADEQEIEPATDADGRKYSRGVVVSGHYFCDRCYRLPVSTSLRGVESEVQVAARPQWRSL